MAEDNTGQTPVVAEIVVALPEFTRIDDGVIVWVTDDGDVEAYMENGRPYVGFLFDASDPDYAEQYGLTLIAAARKARSLAAESGRDGDAR